MNNRLSLVHSIIDNLYSTYTLTEILSDASFRKYYRIHTDNTTYICMDSHPNLENNHIFLNAQHILSMHNIKVPKILYSNSDNGIFILEDFGDKLFGMHQNFVIDIHTYKQVIDTLIHLQTIPLVELTPSIGEYDYTHLHTELNVCKEWFHPDFHYDEIFNFLLSNITSHHKVLVHRDFHSRNLLILENNTIGVIDFQDLIIGSYVYDLASLLKDVYIKLSNAVREELLGYYFTTSEICKNTDYNNFKRDFELIGVQRHIKILGVFSRLAKRDGKKQYLDDIPLTKTYLMEMAKIYTPLQSLEKLCMH